MSGPTASPLRHLRALRLQVVPGSSSLSADGTAQPPASGHRGPEAGAPAGLAEPTAADLAAIEAEWPVIAAEVALVDAECHYLRRPSTTTRAAVRAAEGAVIRAHIQSLAPARPVLGAAS